MSTVTRPPKVKPHHKRPHQTARVHDGRSGKQANHAPAGLPERPRAGLITKLLYGTGGLAFGAKDSGFSYFLLLFYSQVLGVNAALVGGALMLSLIVDAVLDPVIGHLSDHWRSRWGRRHPFMYAAAIPAAGAFYMLWNPPAGLDHNLLFAYLVVTAIVVRTAVSLYDIPSGGLIAELSKDYDDRTSFYSFRVMFGYGGAMIAIICAYALFLQPDAHHPVGQLNPVGYARYGVLASVIIFGAIIVSTAGTHRFIPFLVHPPARPALRISQFIREGFETLSNRSFLMLLGMGIFASIAGGLSGTLDIYFNTYFWQFTSKQIAVVVSAGGFGAVIGPMLSPLLSKRFGKKIGYIVLASSSIIIGFVPTVLRLTNFLLHAGSPALVPIMFCVTLVQASLGMGSVVLIASMSVDIVEDSELSTGRRSEGLLGAANTFISKCVSGFGIFAGGLMLTIANFPQNAQPGPQSYEMARHLAILYVPCQFILYSIAISFCWGYQITRDRHAANLVEIQRRKVLHPSEI